MGRSDETDMEEILRNIFGPGALAEESSVKGNKDPVIHPGKTGYAR